MGKLHGEPRLMLQYVCDMLQQLRAIVPEQAGPMLPHFIEMARMEASDAIVHLGSGSKDTRPPG